MYFFQQLGLSVIKFLDSFILFFRFIGHLWCGIWNISLRRTRLSKLSIIKTIFYSGTTLVIPLVLISVFTGVSMVFNIHSILSRYNLQHQARILAQNILTHDVVPLLIAFLLCIQSALNIINAKIHSIRHLPEEVIVSYIVPIIIGINITGGLLYTYSISAFFISIYVTFIYILHINVHEYFLHITGYITIYDMVYSVLKTSMYCTVVSLTIGYYYYVIAIRFHSIRKTVSQIMTRSFLWLALCSVGLNFFNF